MKENLSNIDNAKDIILNTLNQTIENEQYISVLYILDIIFYNNIDISELVIEKILNDENCTSEIVKAVIIERICNKYASKFNSLLKKFEKKLYNNNNNIDFKTDNWLAKYILYYHGFIKDTDIIQDDVYYTYFKDFKDKGFKFININ